MSNHGLSINLFLADRSWQGVIAAETLSQNAKVLSAPKSQLDDLLKWEEVRYSGVYLLTGPNTEGDFGLEGYIGESDDVGKRLKSHFREKNFWNRVYVATTKDGALSKTHVKFLESRLIEQAKRAPLLARVTNNNDPKYSRVSKPDQASLEDYLEFLKLILPAIGCPLYSFPDFAHAHPGQRPIFPEATLHSEGLYFEMTKGTAHAVAYLKDGQFWVSKGSTARIKELSSLREGYRNTRRTLQEKGIVVMDEKRQLLVFLHDTPFNSPSDAAAIIGTSSLNGKLEWKLMGTKTTFANWEASENEKDKPAID